MVQLGERVILKMFSWCYWYNNIIIITCILVNKHIKKERKLSIAECCLDQILTAKSEGNISIFFKQEGKKWLLIVRKVCNKLTKMAYILTLKLNSASLFKQSVSINNISQLCQPLTQGKCSGLIVSALWFLSPDWVVQARALALALASLHPGV